MTELLFLIPTIGVIEKSTIKLNNTIKPNEKAPTLLSAVPIHDCDVRSVK